MSQSFNIKAATKAEVVTKIDAEFDKVIEGQSIHLKDREAATRAAKGIVEVLIEDVNRDINVSVSGYVSWSEGERITQASVSVAATLVDR